MSAGNPFAAMIFEPCDAHANDPQYPKAHTCIDPARCAVESLIAGPDPRDQDLGRLHELLDTIEEACALSKSKLASAVLKLIHDERGGPR